MPLRQLDCNGRRGGGSGRLLLTTEDVVVDAGFSMPVTFPASSPATGNSLLLLRFAASIGHS